MRDSDSNEEGKGEGNGKGEGEGGKMVTAIRVVGNEKGDGNEEGNSEPRRHHGQWPGQRRSRVFDGGNNGDGDGDGTRDMAACATTGERGIMVTMDHGFCVCFCVSGETTKNKEESKIFNVP